MMHILVTNDDGVQEPGLLALAQAMRQCGRVSVIAPERNWSGGGHVKTLDRPLRVREVTLADGSPALTSDGAPSDCVAMALLGLLEDKVDLVVAGINPTAKLGHDVTYSGTVTAVMEAIIWGTAGVAVSLDGAGFAHDGLDYSIASRVARLVVRKVIQHGLRPGAFLNVNLPNLPICELKGIHLTRQGLRVYRDRLDIRQDPRGRDYYWIGGDTPTGIPEDGTDVGAIATGYVSVTPLQLDLTAPHALPDWVDWSEQWNSLELAAPADPSRIWLGGMSLVPAFS